MIAKIMKSNHDYEQNPVTYKNMNVKINVFNGMTEIIYHKKDWEIRTGKLDYDLIDTTTNRPVDRGRIFYQDENGLPQVIKGQESRAGDNKLSQHITKSSTRATDHLFSYGLSNLWGYWCTYTVAKNQYDFSDNSTRKYWESFRMKLQYHFPEIRILCVLERHVKGKTEEDKGNIHFHCLLGGVDLDNVLMQAKHFETGLPYKKFRKNRGYVQIYDMPMWGKGWAKVEKIPLDNNNVRVMNYLCEYTSPQNFIGLNKKRYYATKNLNKKETYVTGLLNGDVEIITKDFDIYKNTDKFTVFRIYQNIENLIPQLKPYEDEYIKEKCRQARERKESMREELRKQIYGMGYDMVDTMKIENDYINSDD